MAIVSDFALRSPSVGLKGGLVALLFSVAVATSTVHAQSTASKERTIPGAPRLLPVDTLAYMRLDSADDLRDDLKNSSIGRMIDDPKMRPFADEFYATARELFDQISDRVGVSLDELLSIPHGQVAIAVHPAKPLDDDEKPELSRDDVDQDELDRRREQQRRRDAYGFGGVLIIDAGPNIDQLMKIIAKVDDAIVSGGLRRRVKKLDDTEIVRFLPGRPSGVPVEYFEREGILVFGLGHRSAQDVLDHWLGESDEDTLADNTTFGTIMSRCIGAESTRPQITFYADPHGIVDRIIKLSGNMTAGFVWPMVQDMGASRIGGIGGSSFRGGEIFEDISHMHFKIEPPRDGILGVLRPETGDTTPPNWVPKDASGYTSIHWDLEQTYENVGKIVDQFQGPDSLKRLVEQPVEQRLGLKIKEDLFENVTGRIVRVTWMQKPIRLNSTVASVGVELKDAIKAKAVIANIRDRDPNMLQIETIAGNVVYRFRGVGDRFPQGLRRPEPSLVILGKWLIYSDSVEFIEKASLANVGSLPRLIDLPEYDLVTSELGGKLDGEKPFILSFFHSSDGIRLFYDLAKEESTRQFLRQVGQSNPVAKKFSDLIERNELPPFSEFEKYFAPSGVFGYDEPDGIHFGFYTLRPSEE